jgi:hypothetical protein
MNPLMLSHRLTFPNGLLETATQTMLEKMNSYLTAVKRLEAFNIQAKDIANSIGTLVDGCLLHKPALLCHVSDDVMVTKANVANYLANELTGIRDALTFDLTSVNIDIREKLISIDTHPQVYFASDEQSDPNIIALRQAFISVFDGIYCVSDEAILFNGIRGDIFQSIQHAMTQPEFVPLDALQLINETIVSSDALETLDDESLDEVKNFAVWEFRLTCDASESSLEEVADALVEKVKALSGTPEKTPTDWQALKAVDYGHYQDKANRIFEAVDFYLSNKAEINRIDESLVHPYDHDAQFFFYGVYLVSDKLIELAEADVNYVYETGESCSAIFKLHADALPDAKLFMQGYDLFIRAL